MLPRGLEPVLSLCPPAFARLVYNGAAFFPRQWDRWALDVVDSQNLFSERSLCAGRWTPLPSRPMQTV